MRHGGHWKDWAGQVRGVPGHLKDEETLSEVCSHMAGDGVT